MNIFISYPREKKDKAIIIASELSGVGDTIFIDENSIEYSDEWKVKVKEGLKKSNIFIILYNLDEKSSQDPSRFIYTEIKLIEKEIIRKPKKKAIIVIFPPAKANTVPPFFKKFNMINYNEGDVADYDWTSKVAESVEKIKKNNKLFKWLKVIAPIFLILSGIAYLYNSGKIVNPFTGSTPITPITSTTLPSKPKSCSDAASVGNRTYAMSSPYIYIETEESAGVKFFSISKEGTWSEVQCVLRENKYYLEGQEQTTHMVFYTENNKELTYFGTSTNNTESSISFNAQGIASLRTFTKPKDYTVKTTCENTICQKDILKKQELEKKYSRLVEEKHKAGINDYCKASILYGKDFDKSENSIYVVSICKNYTRVMRGSFSE